MRKTTKPEEALQAVLDGAVEKAPKLVIDLAKIAVALEPASRPAPNPQFKARLRSQLMAQASVSEEDAFAAMLEGDRTIVLDELEPLANLANAMAATARRAEPSAEFRFQLRNQLVAHAEQQAPARSRISARVAAFNGRMRRSLRAVGATGIAAMLMLGSGAALAASHSADPGDALYGVKRFRESAQLAFAHGQTRGIRLLEFASTRLHEVSHLTQRHVTDQNLYVGALDDMDAKTIEGTQILIDEFRAHGARSALERVLQFSHNQTTLLSALIDRLPPGARPAALDSLDVAERAGARADSVLKGCPCPTNVLEQPAVGEAAGAPATQPVQCVCGRTGNDSGSPAGGSTSPGGTNNPGGAQPGPQPSPAPQPSPSLLDQIPDAPGPIDDQVKETIEPILPSGLPSTLPTSTPTLPVPLPSASLPVLAPSALPSLPIL